MRESLDNAKEELKRADHLIFVSLKYTRTVDVIKSIVERLLNAFNLGIEALLIHAKGKGGTDTIPTIPKIRCQGAGSGGQLRVRTFPPTSTKVTLSRFWNTKC